jgi:hypothetical protein
MSNKYPITKVNGITKTKHRLVVEKIIGRPLKKNEIVHHKDGNKKNYSKDNLKIVSFKEHNLIHHPIIKIKCNNCGKIRISFEKNYLWRIAHGQKNFYCSKKCAIKKTLGTYLNIDKLISKEIKKGKTGYEIAKKYNLNRVTVYNHLKKLNPSM